eukprot:6921870-Prymnesium_polylepis.1
MVIMRRIAADSWPTTMAGESTSRDERRTCHVGRGRVRRAGHMTGPRVRRDAESTYHSKGPREP